MKAFEEEHEFQCRSMLICMNLDAKCNACKSLRASGWRAALKWVLSWETDHESREIITKELAP